MRGVRMKRELGFTWIICLALTLTVISCGEGDDDEAAIVRLEGSYDGQASNIDLNGTQLIFTNTPETIYPSVIYAITDEADLSEFNTLLANLGDSTAALDLPSLDTYDYFIFKAANACTGSYELLSTEQRNGSITFTFNVTNLDNPEATCIENYNLELWIYRGLEIKSSENEM
jgi:hypothetical protein